MITFYLNECLPSSYNGNLQDIFNVTFEKFVKLVKEVPDEIDKCIISSKLPSEISIAKSHLDDLIKGCSDRELRAYVFRVFTKYPIDSFYDFEELFTEEELCDYSFEERDAFNLYVAFKMNWVLYTLPLSDSLSTSELLISSERGFFPVNNWYGDNNDLIHELIGARLSLWEKRFYDFKYLFEEKQCSYSDLFKEQICVFPLAAFDLISKKFKDAYNAKMLFPVSPDDDLIKHCEGKDIEHTYELRILKAYGGIRVYFYCDETDLIIGYVGTKASSKGKEQSSDIRRASRIINEILNDKTKGK